jgi:hypothetical protein
LVVSTSFSCKKLFLKSYTVPGKKIYSYIFI